MTAIPPGKIAKKEDELNFIIKLFGRKESLFKGCKKKFSVPFIYISLCGAEAFQVNIKRSQFKRPLSNDIKPIILVKY